MTKSAQQSWLGLNTLQETSLKSAHGTITRSPVYHLDSRQKEPTFLKWSDCWSIRRSQPSHCKQHACDVTPSGFSRLAFSMILMMSAVALNRAWYPEFKQFSTSSTWQTNKGAVLASRPRGKLCWAGLGGFGGGASVQKNNDNAAMASKTARFAYESTRPKNWNARGQFACQPTTCNGWEEIVHSLPLLWSASCFWHHRPSLAAFSEKENFYGGGDWKRKTRAQAKSLFLPHRTRGANIPVFLPLFQVFSCTRQPPKRFCIHCPPAAWNKCTLTERKGRAPPAVTWSRNHHHMTMQCWTPPHWADPPPRG